MAFYRKQNNAKSQINMAGGLTVGGLALTVDNGSKFPALGNFLLTIWSKANFPDPGDDSNMEIVLCSARVGNILTIARAQESTTDVVHNDNSAVEMLITAATLEEYTTALSTSAGLAAQISDETGSGVLVFGTSPVFTTDITVPQVQSTQSGNTKLTLQASDTGVGTNNDLFYFKAANVTDYLKLVNSASGLQLINNTGSWQIASASNLTLNVGYTYVSNLFPSSDNSYDFGDANERFRDLFLSRKISDGTNTITMGNPTVFSGNILSPLLIGGTATTSDLSLQTTSGVGEAGADMHFLVGNNGATEAMTILNSGNVGIGTTTPTAVLHLKAGTATANTAPLKIDAGIVNTTPVSGCVESDGTNLYWVDSGGTRRQLNN